MKNSLVIIPTYNERENITRMISILFSLYPDLHLLIIDDASPDGTADAVRKLQLTYPSNLFLLERTGKQGLGTAYIFGFKWSLQHAYEYIFEMDADFSHAPADLMKLYTTCAQEGYDVAIGSRYVPGGKVVNWPRDRVMMSYFASVYVRSITWMPVHDTTAGFVCYKRIVLETIDLDQIRFVGYAFQIEMKYAAFRLGFKIKEVPITFVDRAEGISKMTKGIFKEAVTGVITMRWNSFFRSYRKSS